MPAIHKPIKVTDLILDPNNARLPAHLRGSPEKRIIDYMLVESSLLELMQAIGENGFFEGEHLLVVPDKNDKYRVIEGNRRLAAVKLLKDPTLATVQMGKVKRVVDEAQHTDIKQLPCVIFDKEQEIHRYLGFRHITGVEPWNLRQRAEYLDSLRLELFKKLPLDDACRELAKIIGSRRDYVKRVVVGYHIFCVIRDHDFFKIKGLTDDKFYFGYMADSLRQPNITSFLGVNLASTDPLEDLNRSHLKEWTRWFFEPCRENETRVKGTSLALTKLNVVLSHERARKAFIRDTLDVDEAYELTANIEDLFATTISKARSQLQMAAGLTSKLEHFYGRLDDDLNAITRSTRKIKEAKDELEA